MTHNNINDFKFNLKSQLEKFNINANKKLGQHFLKDQNIIFNILRHVNIEAQNVLEVGCGPGILTDALLRQNLKKLYIIEYDKNFTQAIEYIKSIHKKDCEVFFEDALKILPSTIINDRYSIIANLPYNIGTELLIFWLNDLKHINNITVMLQKEVIDRIVAKPNSKVYGRLSVIMQIFFDLKVICKVPAAAFSPAPKVLSAVISLTPKQDALSNIGLIKTLEQITFFSFSQRRKMLKSSLKKHLTQDLWQNIIQTIDLNENLRPEDLSPEVFLQIAKMCKEQSF